MSSKPTARSSTTTQYPKATTHSVRTVRVGSPGGSASQRARRLRIVEAALRLLEERSYDQIQIRDIAEAAGVALGTLYRYFPSKERLFAEVLVVWTNDFESNVRGRRAVVDTPEERLIATLRRVCRAFDRYPQFFRLIMVLEVATDPPTVELFRQHSERFNETLLAALSDVEPDDARDIATVVSSLMGSLLRSLTLGLVSMRFVLDQLDRAVRLIFGAPRLLPPLTPAT